ncbi:hypothetical protein JTB14_019550 [Gonioctena quinquepunctata]|nr:hypothetical protein JTB14_019550 [Gonioctena quinquepunctata]
MDLKLVSMHEKSHIRVHFQCHPKHIKNVLITSIGSTDIEYSRYAKSERQINCFYVGVQSRWINGNESADRAACQAADTENKLYSPGFALDTRLTSSNVLAGKERPHCEMCNVQKTMAHIMNDCPKFRLEQQQLSSQIG